MAKTPKLLFVDTNIWLDFYRVRNDVALSLLDDLMKVSPSIIVTHQSAVEFKANRLVALREGFASLSSPPPIASPGFFSNAKAVAGIKSHLKEVEARVQKLRQQLLKAVARPTVSDPVFKTFQRIFRKQDGLVLGPSHRLAKRIRRAALDRFLRGYPPR